MKLHFGHTNGDVKRVVDNMSVDFRGEILAEDTNLGAYRWYLKP